jgi:hypothetical protein
MKQELKRKERERVARGKKPFYFKRGPPHAKLTLRRLRSIRYWSYSMEILQYIQWCLTDAQILSRRWHWRRSTRS